MANSEAGMSSNNVKGEFEVFLNFCGQDTRRGFASFLYQDLVRNDIDVFMDEEKIRVGEEISRELLEAIDGSQMYIPIFSTNYASSKWCLRELAKMVDNISNSEEKKILPIFYNVEPNDVDLETPSYGMAIKKHEEEFPQEVDSWKKALKKVKKIKGWKRSEWKNEPELTGLVVDGVLERLERKNNFVTKDLFGIEGQVAKVVELLAVSCSDKVVLLGIYGTGGIGKTTLVGLVYNELSSCFGKCCAFLDDIREMSKKKGLVWLQKKLLTEIASSNSAEIISGVDNGRDRIEETLRSKKVLIILDDVDKEEQIENLIGQHRLHCGTRIIITTREKNVLETLAREMKKMNSDHALHFLPYEMEEMSFDNALQLFKRHAFPKGFVKKDLGRLSSDIIFNTKTLPLAVQVIGSLLCEKSKLNWENTLNQLKNVAYKPVQEKLMISYNTLNYYQCQIFLDIAYFFINENMTNANYMWEARELELDPLLYIEVLLKMSLIKMKDNNKFWMHDQLRDLGREIVHQISPRNLGEQSRLRITEENLDFVVTEESKEDVEALDLWGRSSHISISHEEIAKFQNLEFLRLSNGTLHGDSVVRLPELKWISWHSPSPNFSVASMDSTNLVVLELFNNQFVDNSKVWGLIEKATKLKSLALVECCCITRTPDFSKCLALERLTFDYCKSLKEIGSVIGKLTCLLDLNITHCGLVKRIPDEIRELVCLHRFSLESCDKVCGLPTSIGNLTALSELDLSNTSITSLPDSIIKLSGLSYLNLLGSKITEIPDKFEELVGLQHLCLKDTKIKQLSNSIGKLKSLCTLDLSSHKRTELNSNRWKFPKAIGRLDKLKELYLGHRRELEGKIPDEIRHLCSLRVLDLCWTRISGVPETINMLSSLSTLDLTRCDEITWLPDLPTSLVRLRVESHSLQVVPNLSGLTNLVELVLSSGSNNEDSSDLKQKCDLGWIGRLSKLKKLELCLLNIAALPMDLGPLSLLEDLTWGSLDLQPLEQLPPSLLSLELVNFSSTGSLLSKLKIPLDLTLRLSRLQEIQLNGILQLQHLHLDRCELQSLGMSASLEELSINDCQSIDKIVLGGESIYCSLRVLLLTNALKKLKRLRLQSCKNLLEIQVISRLLSLQYILIESCDAVAKLSGISNLKELHHLDIDECSRLQVVEGLDELEFLSSLDVKKCPSLERLLDISNSKIPDECLIRVSHCRESLDSSSGDCRIPFKRYKKMMAQQGAPQPQTSKEEAKMEEDAIETDTELVSLFHSSASSWDHEISKEPPIDKDRVGTPPVKKIQRRQQDSNHLTISPLSSTKLEPQFNPSASYRDHEMNEEPPIDNVREGTPPGNQNQTRQQDSSSKSLDELAQPRTFSNRFKTCLVSILECVCNRDFPSFKAEFFEGRNRRNI